MWRHREKHEKVEAKNTRTGREPWHKSFPSVFWDNMAISYHLTSGFQSPELCDTINFYCVKPQFVLLCYSSHRKLTHLYYYLVMMWYLFYNSQHNINILLRVKNTVYIRVDPVLHTSVVFAKCINVCYLFAPSLLFMSNPMAVTGLFMSL
jgi:hypothetical protein